MRNALDTPKAVRALDGPALTHRAWHLGLAPLRTGARPLVAWEGSHGEVFLATDDGYSVWEPHVDLAQADAVFRRLRAQDWETQVTWFPWSSYGLVSVVRRTREGQFITARSTTFVLPGEQRQLPDELVTHNEAHALLLCAVLATTEAL